MKYFVSSLCFCVILPACVNHGNKQNPDKLLTELNAPIFESSSTPQNFQANIEKTILEIEKSLLVINPINKKMTLYGIPNMSTSIWNFDSSKPIKIEHKVYNDSGEVNGVFVYYFIKSQLWYSDQIFAKYLFENGQLQFWLDENYNINTIPKVDLVARESHIHETINKILSE